MAKRTITVASPNSRDPPVLTMRGGDHCRYRVWRRRWTAADSVGVHYRSSAGTRYLALGMWYVSPSARDFMLRPTEFLVLSTWNVAA